MSKDYEYAKIDNKVNGGRQYTSQDLIKGFSRFNDDAKNSDSFTKDWLWHSLMIVQHYALKEKTLTAARLREIMNLRTSAEFYEESQRNSYRWLSNALVRHPETKDLIEALIRFLEHNSSDYKAPGTKREKNWKDYVGFASNTMYVMGSAGIAALFLPNFIMSGLVFAGLVIVGSVIRGIYKKGKKVKYEKSIKNKIVEIDNLPTNEKTKSIVDLMSDHSYDEMNRYPELNAVFKDLVVSTKRFAGLYQKHESNNLEAYFTVESVWKNTMPSLLKYELSDEKVRAHALEIMGKMKFLINRYVQDLMEIELRGISAENIFWDDKISTEKNAMEIR